MKRYKRQAVEYKRVFKEDQEDITKTSEFKKWFGHSKVVDFNRDPLVVYHGGSRKFDTFSYKYMGDTDDLFLGAGFYFSSSKKIAKWYGSKIIECYLSIENPLIIEDSYSFGGVHPDKIKEILGLSLKATPKNIWDELKKQGYDGVIVNSSSNKMVEIVALKPNQIKSATDNNGEFSKHSNNIYESKFSEDLHLSDFKKHSGASDFTRDWVEIRRKLKGAGNKSAKLKSMKVNRKKDYITFIFQSSPTYASKADAVDPTTMGIVKTVRKYTQMIQINDFFKYAETKPGYKKNELTWKEVKEILQVAPIKVWCNDPSFQYQGMNYIVTTFDAAIYPELRAPERWNKLHNDDNFLCKHLSMIFNSIDFFSNQMVSMLNKYLKGKK